MKYLLFFAVLAIVGCEINADYAKLYALGIRTTIFSRAAAPPTCTKSGPECATDCSTLMLCALNTPTPLTTQICSSPKQYCVGSACTSTPSASCTSGPAFTCTSDGIFPEPTNCTQYRQCTAGVGTLYQCPSGFIFDSINNRCTASTARTIVPVPTLPCNTIDCSTKPNGFIVYPSNQAYYAYCAKAADGQITTYMFVCDYPKSQIFDTSVNQCIYNCIAQGYYQDPADCQGYYYCSAAKAKPTLLECEVGYVFDGVGCNKDPLQCKFPPPPPPPAP